MALLLGTSRSVTSTARVASTLAIARRVFATTSRRLQHSHDHKNTHEHGHSHSVLHSHSHSSADSVLTEGGGLKNPAIRITWIGLLTNVGMAVGKGVGGVVFHSQALVADSMHAISDLFSDFLTLFTVSLGTRPPSKHFPNGYGRIESLGSLGVSSLLLFAGVTMGWSSGLTMLENSGLVAQLPEWLNLGHGHDHSHSHSDVANINAAWIALASIGMKEWLYQATMKVSRQTNSQVLVANAWHHRIDSLVSMVAVLTIGGGHFYNLSWLDPLGGLVVSGMIFKAGWGTTKTACYELADCNARLDDDVPEHVETLTKILADERLAMDVNNVMLMPSGPNYTAYVELKLRDLDALQEYTLEQIRDTVVSRLRQEYNRLRRVTVSIV